MVVRFRSMIGKPIAPLSTPLLCVVLDFFGGLSEVNVH